MQDDIFILASSRYGSSMVTPGDTPWAQPEKHQGHVLIDVSKIPPGVDSVSIRCDTVHIVGASNQQRTSRLHIVVKARSVRVKEVGGLLNLFVSGRGQSSKLRVAGILGGSLETSNVRNVRIHSAIHASIRVFNAVNFSIKNLNYSQLRLSEINREARIGSILGKSHVSGKGVSNVTYGSLIPNVAYVAVDDGVESTRIYRDYGFFILRQ